MKSLVVLFKYEWRYKLFNTSTLITLGKLKFKGMKKKVKKLKVKKLGVLNDSQLGALLGGSGELTVSNATTSGTTLSETTTCPSPNPNTNATTRATTASGVPTCPADSGNCTANGCLTTEEHYPTNQTGCPYEH